MKIKKAHKVLLLIGLSLLVLQLPWYLAVQAYVNNTQGKTTATVIRIDSKATRCSDIFRRDPTCNRSDILFPVYEYYDQEGARYVETDEFINEFKENNPLRKIFQKEVGDQVPAYYSKNNPQEVAFMSSVYSYLLWLVPLYFAIFMFIIFCIVFVYDKLKKRVQV